VAQPALGFSAQEGSLSDDDGLGESQSISGEDSKGKAPHKVPPMITNKKVVNNITRWNQVKGKGTNNVPGDHTPLSSSAMTVTEVPVVQEAEHKLEYSDTKAMTCLLCSRQFKSTEQLSRHNSESALHRKNLEDANLCQIAKTKVESTRSQTSVDQSAKYRDRAFERRILHNQPDIPADIQVPGKRQAEGPPPPPSPPPPPAAPAKDESNIGNKLLKMMGWTEGSGLGLEGDGRVDPVQASIYATGVGLGASKGKEVGKYAEGYSGYVNMARDSAKERYASQ